MMSDFVYRKKPNTQKVAQNPKMGILITKQVCNGDAACCRIRPML